MIRCAFKLEAASSCNDEESSLAGLNWELDCRNDYSLPLMTTSHSRGGGDHPRPGQLQLV